MRNRSNRITLLAPIFFLLLCSNLFAQNAWQDVADPSYVVPNGITTSTMRVNPVNNERYVAYYANVGSVQSIYVIHILNAGGVDTLTQINAVNNQYFDMEVDTLGNIYLAYQTSPSQRLAVSRYNGTTLTTVGTNLSFDEARYIDIEISPATNLPWVAYRDMFYDNASVQSYNGTSWSYPSAIVNFGPTNVNRIDLEFDPLDHNPTVCLRHNIVANQYPRLFKYVGSNWNQIGAPTLPYSITDIKFEYKPGTNIPYIMVGKNSTTGSPSEVFQLFYNDPTDSSWVADGPAFGDQFTGGIYDLAFHPITLMPHCLYRDVAALVNGSPSLVKFNGIEWISVGKQGIDDMEVVGANKGMRLVFNPVNDQPEVFLPYRTLNGVPSSPRGFRLKTLPCTPDVPTITSINNGGCFGEAQTFEITGGELNGADFWVVYKDNCLGQIVDSISSGVPEVFIGSADSTLYIGAVGTCTAPGACVSVAVDVRDSIPKPIILSNNTNASSFCSGPALPVLSTNAVADSYCWTESVTANGWMELDTTRLVDTGEFVNLLGDEAYGLFIHPITSETRVAFPAPNGLMIKKHDPNFGWTTNGGAYIPYASLNTGLASTRLTTNQDPNSGVIYATYRTVDNSLPGNPGRVGLIEISNGTYSVKPLSPSTLYLNGVGKPIVHPLTGDVYIPYIYTSGGNGIFSLYKYDNGWTTPFTVALLGLGEVELAFDSNGDIIMVGTTSSNDVELRKYNTSGTLLSSSTVFSGNASNPEFILNSQDEATVMYQSSGGVFVRKQFGSSWIPLGINAVNNGVTGSVTSLGPYQIAQHPVTETPYISLPINKFSGGDLYVFEYQSTTQDWSVLTGNPMLTSTANINTSFYGGPVGLSFDPNTKDLKCFAETWGIAFDNPERFNLFVLDKTCLSDSSSFSPTELGSYSLTIADSAGCSATSNVFGTGVFPSPTVSTSSIDASCFGVSDGQASAMASGGSGSNYSYNWSNGEAGATIDSLAAGIYDLTILDSLGCSATATVTVAQPQQISLNLDSLRNVSCHSDSNGFIAVTPSGGAGGLSIMWSNGSTNDTIQNLIANAYNITVTDQNGCTDSASYTLSEPTPLTVQLTSVHVSCFDLADGSLSASPSGGVSPYSYAWSDGQTNATATALDTGMYSVTITDHNGCILIDSGLITQPDSLEISLIISDSISCSGLADGALLSNVLGGVSPYTYIWSNGSSNDSLNGVSIGNYSLTVTDANNCNTSDSATMDVIEVFDFSLIQIDSILCTGDATASITAISNGGTAPFNYQWNTNSINDTLLGVTAGIYTLTLTDVNGCNDSSSISITEPTLLAASTTVVEQVDCNGANTGHIEVQASGGTGSKTFVWSNSTTSFVDSNLLAGTYFITVTDQNACTIVVSDSLAEPDVISVTAVQVDSVLCNNQMNGAIMVQATGGTGVLSFNWSNGATSANNIGLSAGMYTYSITDANGCIFTDSAAVFEPNALNLTLSLLNGVSCFQGTNGSAVAQLTGGTPNYSYTWGNGGSNDTNNTLPTGMQAVTVTDNNSCSISDSIFIPEPSDIIVSLTIDSTISCNGFSNGAISASANGGSGTLNYLWNTGMSSTAIQQLVAGTYTVTVTDSNACNTSASVTLNEPAPINLSLSVVTEVNCFGEGQGALGSSVNGGTTPYNYSWSNGLSDSTINGLIAGTYTLTVSDSAGCVLQESIILNEPDSISVQFDVQNALCESTSDGSIKTLATGGIAPYTYNWNDGSTADSLIDLPIGTYYMTLTDVNNCLFTDSATISFENNDPQINLPDTTEFCIGSSIQLDAGNPGASYEWNTGETSQNIVVSDSGEYSVTVTSALGCQSEDTSWVVVNPCLGVTDLSSESIEVFPNPTRGLIYVKSLSDNFNLKRVVVWSKNGQIITTTQIFDQSNYTVDLSNIATGTYFIEVETNTGLIHRSKIIKL